MWTLRDERIYMYCQIEEYTFQGFEAFTAATVLYILVTTIVMATMRFVERRVAIPGMISLGAK